MKPRVHRTGTSTSAFARAPGLDGSTPAPAGFTAKRAPGVPTINITGCSQCGAGIGELCVSKSGKETRNYHRPRKVKAIRIYNEQQAKIKELQLPEEDS